MVDNLRHGLSRHLFGAGNVCGRQLYVRVEQAEGRPLGQGELAVVAGLTPHDLYDAVEGDAQAGRDLHVPRLRAVSGRMAGPDARGGGGRAFQTTKVNL